MYAPQSTLDEAGRRVLVAWARMPSPVDGTWSGMFCLPRLVEVEKGHIYFRVHPNIRNRFTREIRSAAEAEDAGYCISLCMEEGEKISIGGYRISRADGLIHTDRTEVLDEACNCRMQFVSPEVREGNRLDIYVDKNLIEVYINDGEYVISNVVYGLKDEIEAECKSDIRMYTVEED